VNVFLLTVSHLGLTPALILVLLCSEVSLRRGKLKGDGRAYSRWSAPPNAVWSCSIPLEGTAALRIFASGLFIFRA
jgi:hypothetical protein